MKRKSDTEMDDIETILYASPKRENDIDDRAVVAYASPRRESENEIDEKIYKEPKLETAVEIEKQTAEREKKISKVNWSKTRLIFKFQENLILKMFRTFLTWSKKKSH